MPQDATTGFACQFIEGITKEITKDSAEAEAGTASTAQLGTVLQGSEADSVYLKRR